MGYILKTDRDLLVGQLNQFRQLNDYPNLTKQFKGSFPFWSSPSSGLDFCHGTNLHRREKLRNFTLSTIEKEETHPKS